MFQACADHRFFDRYDPAILAYDAAHVAARRQASGMQ